MPDTVPDEEVSLQGTMWVQATYMECDRFEEVFREWEAARVDATLRARLNDDTELARLPWPSERLHFGWWIPRLPEGEWPTEPMPEGVAELLAERFRRLRERDGFE